MLRKMKLFALLLLLGMSFTFAIGEKKADAKEKDKYPQSSGVETESNNNRNEANEVVPNETVTGNITKGDQDYYKFVFPSDGLLTISFFRTSSAKNSYYFYVYDSQLNELYNFYNKDNTFSWDSRVLNYKKGTVLYFRVSGWNNSFDYSLGENYELSFSYEDAVNWETGSNENKNEATSLKSKTYGTIMTKDDVDYFSFTPSKNGYVNFEFINEDAVTDTYGWYVTVYDNKLTQLYEYKIKTDDTIGTYICKKKTPIYIKITKNGSEVVTAKYSIKPVFKSANIETEPNNSEADKIKLNKVYCGTLIDAKDVDYYKFTATKTGKYKLIYNMKDIDEQYKFYSVSVLDSDKKEISNLQLHGNDSVKFDVKKGKTYYVCVKLGKNGTDMWGSSWIQSLYKIKIKTK